MEDQSFINPPMFKDPALIHTNAHCALYSLYSIRSLNLNHAEGITAAVVLISNVVAHKFSVPIAGCIYEKGTQFQTQIQIEAQEQDIGFPGFANQFVQKNDIQSAREIQQTTKPLHLGIETLASEVARTKVQGSNNFNGWSPRLSH